MNTTKILSIVFLLASLGLAFYLGNSIKSSIDEREMIESREAAIVAKLELIREAEIVYQEVNGNYTSDWDKLINFIKYDSFPIIQRRETIIPKDYGGDSVIVELDTLEIIPAKDRIFQKAHNVNAANDGIFQGFAYNQGDEVLQGNKAYTLDQNGKMVTHKFKNSGTIVNQQSVAVGSTVTKGDLLMSLIEFKFDPNVNLDRLAYVPGYDDVKFDIYAAEIDKNGVLVDVVEVKNPKPFNPARDESNDAKNKKPLRFGSKTEVTTSGNWE